MFCIRGIRSAFLIVLFVLPGSHLRAQTAQIDSLSRAATEAAAHPGGSSRAVSLYREILALVDADPAQAARFHIELGLLFYQVGEPDSMFSHAKRALSYLLLPNVPVDTAGIVQARIQIAYAHLQVAEADSAEKYFRAALPDAVDDADALGSIYNGLGRVFQLVENPDSALIYHRVARDTWRSGGIDEGVPFALHDMGMAYLQRREPDSARVYYDSALVLLAQGRDTTEMASTLSEIGRLLAMTGRPDSAFAFYWRAHAQDSVREDRHSMAANFSNIGAAFQECMRPELRLEGCNRPDSAFYYYHLGLQEARAARHRQGVASALTNIASLSRLTGDLPQAAAYADSAAAIWATIRMRAGADASRVSSAERFGGLFHVWSLAWLGRASEPGVDSASAAWAALAAAERGRAQALLDLMRAKTPDVAPGADMVAEGQALARATAGSAAVIEYVVTPDTILIWLILPEGTIHLFRTRVSASEVSVAVDSLRLALGVPPACTALPADPPQDYERWLNRLAGWLLPLGLRQRLPSSGGLVISPHGALNRIPFASLRLDPGGDLLGLKYAVRYTPSLAALLEAERRPEHNYYAPASDDNVLIVGDPEMPTALACRRSYQLPGLPGAGAFAQELARSFGQTAFVRENASEVAVRERLPAAHIVFFGTHAYAYETPARAPVSFIALAATDTTRSSSNGLFTVAEVFELPPLQASLVVLSACRTALGESREAEGTVGLQRAFLARGARTLLVSQWDVSQEVTVALMSEFFQRLRAEPAVGEAEALRRAQIEIHKRWPHPRLWAAFQLVGAR